MNQTRKQTLDKCYENSKIDIVKEESKTQDFTQKTCGAKEKKQNLL